MPHTFKKAFTLFELMIVIVIITILLVLGLFPYHEYVKRATLNKTLDTLEQGWIYAHKNIRNGLLLQNAHTKAPEEKHAYILLVFEKGKTQVSSYILEGKNIPDTLDNEANTEYHSIHFDPFIEILGFSGLSDNKLYYLIEPPVAKGTWFDASKEEIQKDISVIVGYPRASLLSGRAREILLKPYLQ